MTPAHHIRVLMADDDPLFLDSVEDELAEYGVVVLRAHCGVEAERVFAAERPDCVLLDCGLAGVSELALIDRIRRSPHRVPVGIVSARQGPLHERMMLVFGASFVLSKPPGAGTLFGAIATAIAPNARISST